MRKIKTVRFAVLITMALVLAGCTVSGNEVPYTPERPDKLPPNSKSEVRVALYVDISDSGAETALETVGNYFIEMSEGQMPYFDYVVLSGALIKGGRITPVLQVSDDLEDMLYRAKTNIRHIQSLGIKVLLGIKGGRDGVSFGNIKDLSQIIFAQQCADACNFYGFDGVEFWDEDAERAGISGAAYPQYGNTYYYGTRRNTADTGIVEIPAQGQEGAEEKLIHAWKEGGKNMSNVMSYLMSYFGAYSSEQGDVNFTHKFLRPILVREIGYGRWLPDVPERFDFDSILTCMTYGINNEKLFSGQFSFGASFDGMVSIWISPPVDGSQTERFVYVSSGGGRPDTTIGETSIGSDAGIDHIEITFSPPVSGITQPLKIPDSTGEFERIIVEGFTANVRYNFTITAMLKGPEEIVTATASSGGGAAIAWTDPNDANLDHIEITFSPQAAGVEQPIRVNKGVQTASIQGLLGGQEYRFTVTAMLKGTSVTKPATPPWETGLSIMSSENTPFTGVKGFMSTRDYGPVQIDLSAIDQVRLEYISQRLGTSGFGTPEEEYSVGGDCDYGLVYYINLQPYSEAQRKHLSVTSQEVFGKEVRYKE